MTTVTTEDVQRNLPALLERLRPGETLLIENFGETVATLTAAPQRKPPVDVSRRIGFLKGHGSIPENWKELSRDEIEKEFYGEE